MKPQFSPILLAFILNFLSPAVQADNGMDMSMDGAMALTGANMVPYLHFTPGDTLWFLGWVPKSKGAMVGTCIGLFLLALVDRWLASIRATAENYWRRRSQIILTNKLNASPVKQSSTTKLYVPRHVPPFILAHDVSRGVLHAGQATLGFAFMLVVMTYQASFIISIIVGLGVGETLFGRYISAASVH
ncbi:hypothetical protein GALMADRAFT_65303 [Galerina marginata CBS 339.88]|uniref:Copper transport protein n=1 Tax=Galerina marginata (strain CBS 339.88) TaxID=685588 RepID=A0A067T471_GALM3|nr:hypothetical protein GALMADRAFT_65303 [Galerina marginata CBS 339.88]